MLNLTRRVTLPALLLLFLLASAFILGLKTQEAFFSRQGLEAEQTGMAADQDTSVYVDFLLEIYDLIQQNYWQKLDEQQLVNLFLQAGQDLTGQAQVVKAASKQELASHLRQSLKEISGNPAVQKELVASLADLVLASLEPPGRSRLYTAKDKENLTRNVNNINSQGEVEPSLEAQLIHPKILHLRWKKFSPNSFEELKALIAQFDQGAELDTLILDLRDNVGGSIDGLPFFLGPFIGLNQYSYQILSRGEVIDFKTKTGWLPGLVRYKKVVILVNENTQSTAEVMAAVLKKYNVGVLLGVPTRGWGTVERVFPLQTQISPDEKHSVFLVHSLTLREDGLPIQGNGVEPAISLANPSWEKELLSYFNFPELVTAVKEILR